MTTLEELKYYYSCKITKVGKEVVEYNPDYGVEYSQKALSILEHFRNIDDVNDSVRDARIYYDIPDMDIHILLSYIIYKAPRAEHVRTCRKCGRAFNYEHILKPVNLKTGKLVIPTKCPECSGNY